MKVLAIRDIVANVWFNPIVAQTTGMVVRDFGDRCSKPSENNPFAEHPGDFELYELGDWNETEGTFNLHDKPKQVAVGANWKKA